MDTRDVPDLMTVNEVADYLRVRERTIYELVRTQRIPSCKLSGKLLFPKRLIELWVAQSADFPQAASHLTTPPQVIAGSHDPLPEWSARESRSGLALLVEGSTGGLHHLLAGEAVACGVHLVDPGTGDYDAGAIAKKLPGLDFVVIEWARRQQGLVVPPGNPLGLASFADLGRTRLRIAMRQEGSGSAMLFAKLAADAGLASSSLLASGPPVSSHADVACSVREGRADAGLAIAAAALEQGLDFVPIKWERFDLVVRRVEFFEPPMQRLLDFARTVEFRTRAKSLGGYDIRNVGNVLFNARR